MDLCILSFNLNCIMQLKQFYNTATKVCSRKNATTFGDLCVSHMVFWVHILVVVCVTCIILVNFHSLIALVNDIPDDPYRTKYHDIIIQYEHVTIWYDVTNCKHIFCTFGKQSIIAELIDEQLKWLGQFNICGWWQLTWPGPFLNSV